MGWVGLSMAVAGALLAGRSALVLAGRGRPRRGPKPELVIAGPYLRIRNPLLAGLLMVLAGTAIAGSSTALSLATIFGAAAAHLWVLLVEEPRLSARFGRAYEAYLRAVPRWLPRLGSREAG